MAKEKTHEEQTTLAVPNEGMAGLLAQAPAAPEVVRDEHGRAVGVELEAEHLEVPRLALVQKMSRITTEKLAEPGDVISTLTLEVLYPLPQHKVSGDPLPHQLPFVIPGSDPVQLGLPFLPFRCFVDRVSFTEKFELQCRSLPGGLRTPPGFHSPAWQEGDGWDKTMCAPCPLKDWGEDGTKPECDLNYNVLGFVLNMDGADVESILGAPIAGAFARTSLKTGRSIATATKLAGRNPWSTVWMLWRTHERNEYGDFFVWRARQAANSATGKALFTPAPLAQAAADVYAAMSGARVNVDYTKAAGVDVEEGAAKPMGTDPAAEADPWDNEPAQ